MKQAANAILIEQLKQTHFHGACAHRKKTQLRQRGVVRCVQKPSSEQQKAMDSSDAHACRSANQ